MQPMTNRKLMELFLNCPETVRRICITEKQIKIINTINQDNRGYISSKELSKRHHITVQNASMQLARLYTIGYLTRVERIAKSGGKEFDYESVISSDVIY